MGIHLQHGFSLTELMIGLALTAVVSLAMYNTFVQQQRITTRQEHITEANQTVRLTMAAMLTELRGAGFDPDGTAGAGILAADALGMRFTRDLNCSGTIAQVNRVLPPPQTRQDTGAEDILYAFNPVEQTLTRRIFEEGAPAGPPQPVANNIIAGGFCYFLAADLTRCITNPGVLDDIRVVQITLTARASAPDPQYTDPTLAANNPLRHYHRATLTSRLHMRNLGINRGPVNRLVPFNNPCPLP